MKKWAVLFGAVIVAIIVMADTGRLGFLSAVYSFPFGDKIGHFTLYGILTLLVNLAAFEAWPKQDRKRMTLLAMLLLAVPIGLEEWSQRFIHGREASIWDLSAGYLGLAVFAWVGLQIERRRRAPETGSGPKNAKLGKNEIVPPSAGSPLHSDHARGSRGKTP